MFLESRDREVRRLQILTSIQRPGRDNSRPCVGEWTPTVDGGFMRLVFIPGEADRRKRYMRDLQVRAEYERQDAPVGRVGRLR